MKIWKYRQLADWFYKRPALADVNWKNPTIRSNYWQSTTKASKTSWTVALTHSLTAGHLSTLRSFLFWPATMKRHSFMGVGKLVKLITTRLSYIHIIGQIQSKFKEPTRGGKPLFIRFVRGGGGPTRLVAKGSVCVCVCVEGRGGQLPLKVIQISQFEYDGPHMCRRCRCKLYPNSMTPKKTGGVWKLIRTWSM